MQIQGNKIQLMPLKPPTQDDDNTQSWINVFVSVFEQNNLAYKYYEQF